MLGKHWKLYLINASDANLDFDDGGEVNVRYQGWGIASGNRVDGPSETDNFVFTTADVLVAGGAGLAGAPVDNSSDKFFGVNGTLELAINDVTSAGFYELYVEYSDLCLVLGNLYMTFPQGDHQDHHLQEYMTGLPHHTDSNPFVGQDDFDLKQPRFCQLSIVYPAIILRSGYNFF